MSYQLNPYLSFASNAAAAMDFYATVFGGSVEAMTFGMMPDLPGYDESMKDLIMHSSLSADSEVPLMGSDHPEQMGPPAANGTISLSGTDEARLRGWWDKLADGAEISMPLEKAPWGDSFGQLTDKFGVNWIVNIGQE